MGDLNSSSGSDTYFFSVLMLHVRNSREMYKFLCVFSDVKHAQKDFSYYFFIIFFDL